MDNPQIGDIVYYQLTSLKPYLVTAITANQSVVELKSIEDEDTTCISYNALLCDDWKKL